MFLENKFMEAYNSSSKGHSVYCTCTTSFSFNFDWSYPMTHVSSGDKKGVIFCSFLLALSCGHGVDNFFQEEHYLVTIFSLKSNLRQKSRNPFESLQYCQYLLASYLNVIYIVAGISTPNFALV